MVSRQRRKEDLQRKIGNRVNEVAHALYPLPPADVLARESVAKFVIVRHPFHRLVSAYRDKLERVLRISRDGDYFQKYVVQYESSK